MLKRSEKVEIVKSLAEQIRGAKAAVFCDFQGLGAKDVQSIRFSLGKEGISYKVVKINLLKKALRLAGVDIKKLNFTKPIAVSLSVEDEAAAARILQGFAKTHEKLKIVSGLLDKVVIDKNQVGALASLPGKQELRGQLVGVIAGPLRALASVLSGNIRGLINVLDAKAKI